MSKIGNARDLGKKLSITLLAILAFIAGSNFASAACQSGYSSVNLSVEFPNQNGGTGTSEVQICYRCSLTAGGPIDVIVDYSTITNYNTTRDNTPNSASEFMERIMQELMNYFQTNNPCTVPDCKQATNEMTFKAPACMRWIKQTSAVDGVTYAQMDLYCSTSYCLERYTVCIDYTTTPPHLVTNYIDKVYGPGTPCSGTYYGTAEDFLNAFENQPDGTATDCFRFNCL